MPDGEAAFPALRGISSFPLINGALKGPRREPVPIHDIPFNIDYLQEPAIRQEREDDETVLSHSKPGAGVVSRRADL